MSDELNPMDKFNFLLGNWNLEYTIPKSFFSEARSDSGKGTFKRALNDKYVTFDYSTKTGGEAKGIFAWDDNLKVYRYWWFENSGTFMEATCNFLSETTLSLNWHNSLLVQTFQQLEKDNIILKMSHPSNNDYEIVLEVIFTKLI
jgi:hypothetical protein